MILLENFSELTASMERLEESPYTKRNNFQREPIQEEINNNSSERLQTVKDLRT